MTAAIQPHSASVDTPAVAVRISTVALQDKLARCVRQLGNWEACPSGKTLEGKKVIENLRAQKGNIEARMANDAAR
jgi:hypothetical protein